MPSPKKRTSSTTPTSSGSGGAAANTSAKPFYAGAKFESHPPCIVLPPPPSHWTTPSQRSQSQPTTPTIVKNNNRTPIDLASLFGSLSATTITTTTSNNNTSMSKSFPGESMMMKVALEKNRKVQATDSSESSDEELKEILTKNKGAKKAVAIANKKEGGSPRPSVAAAKVKATSPPKGNTVNTEDLKKALGLVKVVNNKSPSSIKPMKRSNFKEMSDQLKSLMKVAA